MRQPTGTSDNERAPAQPASAPNKGARILYVDDEDAQLYLGKRLLARMGCRVAVFNDPLAALQAFREQPNDFDLVITDLSMPQLSGMDLVRELRALRAQLPIIMTSGYMSPEDQAAARRLGVTEVVGKPAVAQNWRDALDRLLRRQP